MVNEQRDGKGEGIMPIVAVDPSIGSTGVVVQDEGLARGTLIKPPTGQSQLSRCKWIAEEVLEVTVSVADLLWSDHSVLLVIEGTQGLLKGAARIAPCVGLRIRERLAEEVQLKTLVVAPTLLKKFVTGKGNAQKSSMGAHIMRHWGGEIGNNVPQEDVLEAFALLQFGLCFQRPTSGDWTGYQIEAATQLHGKDKGKPRVAYNDTEDLDASLEWKAPSRTWDFDIRPEELRNETDSPR